MFKLVWKTLCHYPTRTALALLQALIGALVVTLSLALAFSQGQAAGPSNLTQVTSGLRKHNTISVFNTFLISDIPRIKILAPDILQIDVMGSYYVSALEVGHTLYKVSSSRITGPDYAKLTGLKILHGSYFNTKDINNNAKVLAISANVARILYGQENAVGKTINIISESTGTESIPYRVVAITENASPQAQGISSPLLLPINATEKTSSLLLRARPGQLNQAKEQLLWAVKQIYKDDPEVQSAINEKREPFFFSPVGIVSDATEASKNPILRLLYSISALTLIVSSLGVLATILVNVNERTREIGLRRAIGATRAHVFTGILLESGLTTLLGSIIGVLIATILSPMLNILLSTTFQNYPLIISFRLIFIVLGLFLTLSIIFSLLPALIGTRIRPTEALRIQG